VVLNLVKAVPSTTHAVINAIMSTNVSSKADGSLAEGLPSGIGSIIGGIVGCAVVLASALFAWIQCRSGKCKCFKHLDPELERALDPVSESKMHDNEGFRSFQ
jgi:hypothetical protein